MKVLYEFAGHRAEGEASPGAMLLLSNANACFSLSNVSKYNGLLRRDGEHLLRSLENIYLPGLSPDSIRVSPGLIERRYEGGAIETFRLRGSVLHYSVTEYEGEVMLDLDMRRASDGSTSGRRYASSQEGETLVVTYSKYRDDAFAVKEYEIDLEIEGAAQLRKIGDWQERRYPYDERRGEAGAWWVYRLGAVKADGTLALTFSCGIPVKETASQPISEDSLPAALSLSALDSLLAADGGVLAGVPWFMQQWSRDELISAGASIKARRYTLAKSALLRYVSLLEGKDRFDAFYPRGGLKSADSLGWLSKRLYDLIVALDSEKRLKEVFSKHELEALRDKLGPALLRAAAANDVGGLIGNGPLETWMDTGRDGDERAGCRIEIQAGQLAGYALLDLLERKTRFLAKKEWRKREEELRARVRASFLITGRLADGVVDGKRDDTARPNLFLTHHLYPRLLSSAEWSAAFDHALSRLWLDWGGLATIDREHPLFSPRYTGADNRSYHRGDSWYFMNALAAISLLRVDGAKYADKAAKLREACVSDLLFQGALGGCSELSSAESQEWGGCFSQAWSAAALYELLKE